MTTKSEQPVTRPDMSVRVGSVELDNPVMTASGTAGYGTELAAYFDLSALGAFVTKSLSAFEWEGNSAPRLTFAPAGMLNSVGLQNPGVVAWREQQLPKLAAAGARTVASIWGRTVGEYSEAAVLLADAEIVAVEVNVSCPNLEAAPNGAAVARAARERSSQEREIAGDV